MTSAARLNDFVARLRDVLTSKLGNNYAEGSILGDLIVDSHGILLEEFAEDLADLRLRQSLRDLRNLPQTAERDAAIEGLLSNLFVTRDLGRFSRGYATLTFSQRVDTILPRTTRFFRTASLVFYPNLAQDLLIRASEFRAVYDSLGAVAGWAYDVPLIAARSGVAYDIEPGVFTFVDPFSAYLLRTANDAKYRGGADPDSTEQLLTNTEGAVSLRALLSPRSNEATLRSAFSDISRVLTICHGDPEMRRDVKRLFGAATSLHLGAHQDIYVTLPTQAITVTTTIGGAVARADERILVFRDSAATFLTDLVVPGDVLNLLAGPAGAPAQYVVRSVTETELTIGEEFPFSEATDERTPTAPTIQYSIGNNYPNFDNRVSAVTSATATTSRQLAIPLCAILPGLPVYEIHRVEILEPPSELNGYVSPETGSVLFVERRNGPWPRAPLPGEALSYRVRVENPAEAQSTKNIVALELGWPDLPLTGVSVEVTFTTLVGFSSVQAFLQSPEQRISGSNTLARALHPIYIAGTFRYRSRQTVDETALRRHLLATLEATAPGDLDLNTLRTALLNQEDNIRAVLADSLSYELLLPDGRVAKYLTEDQVQVLPDGRSSARLTNASELGLPTSNTLSALRALLDSLGVTDRVACYFSDEDRLTLEQVL